MDAFKITNLKDIEIIIDDSGAIEGLDKIWPEGDARIIVNNIPKLIENAYNLGYNDGSSDAENDS